MKNYPVRSQLGIPYKIEISDKLVHLLMRIAECRPFFTESLSQPLKVTLLRNAKVRAITYSNQIEGNPLNEEEVQEATRSRKKKNKHPFSSGSPKLLGCTQLRRKTKV